MNDEPISSELPQVASVGSDQTIPNTSGGVNLPPGINDAFPPAPSVPIEPSAPLPGVPAVPLPQFDQATVPSLMPTAPQIADDADLIEKEWVDKAKEIVEHTRDDPYKQNQGVNKLKADYIQKRYNKQIKTGEEQ